jgi:hypothetical protein
LISHQILHLKNPKPLTTLEKLKTHKKPTIETSKSNNRNSHKNTKGNCIPRQTPGKLEKHARKKDPKIFHKRETGEMNPKLFSLATRVLPEPHSHTHYAQYTRLHQRRRKMKILIKKIIPRLELRALKKEKEKKKPKKTRV